MPSESAGHCARMFSALSNRHRMRALQLLAVKPMSVNELAEKLGDERTLVSHNLAQLAEAELVEYRNEGNSRIYKANEKVVPYIFLLMENFVCSKCSIRRTCRVLREHGALGLREASRLARKPCKYCK